MTEKEKRITEWMQKATEQLIENDEVPITIISIGNPASKEFGIYLPPYVEVNDDTIDIFKAVMTWMINNKAPVRG